MKAIATLLTAVAAAAVLMGVVFLVTEDWRVQFGVFSTLAVVPALITVWRWLRRRGNRQLSLPEHDLVGRIAEVRQTIPLGQRGDVLVSGTLWVAVSPTAQRDLSRGDWVRVTGVEGMLLVVEPLQSMDKKPPAPGKDTGGQAAGRECLRPL